MSEQDAGDGVELTVQGAEKRDAGRGVARIPESARRALGVLSGDTVVIEGEQTAVSKVWPMRTEDDGEIMIDADTRSNAGVSIGDTVTVSPETVEEGNTVTVAPPAGLRGVDEAALERVVSKQLRNRPVNDGEGIVLERRSDMPFRVVSTTPDGPVRVTEDTTVLLAPAGSAPGQSASTGDTTDGSSEVTTGDATDVSPSSSTDDDQEFSRPTRGRVTYEDIGGLDDELEQVREMIELPLNQPDLFRRFGVDPPKGVLLYGPPGTGKTLIARAVANEVDASFISVDGPEVMSKYKGESEERLRELFDEARKRSPSIVFFDEIDSLAAERDDESGVENRLVAQLLSLMDGLDARQDVIVIGATNRADALDPALRRGGRFDREIEVGVPDETGRTEILEVHTRNMSLDDDVTLDALASRTHGFVGADIDALVTEAALVAIRRARAEHDDLDDLDATVTKRDFDSALATVEPSAMREFVAETPDTGFDDVGGLEEAKQTLTESVEWPLSYTALFDETNTEPPSGVLLYGPPGTGKTLLARALAGETEVNFVHVDGPELMDRYVGESEKAVREVFERARQSAPSIIFFDEIDALVSKRGSDTNEVTERVVSQLLTELDGLAENPNLVVLAATNRKQDIDPALLRPGRLDTHLEIGAPDTEAREQILAVHARGKPLADEIDLDQLAAELDSYTGADLEAVVRNASMRAIRETAEELGPEEASKRADEIEITREHVDEALEEIEPTLGAEGESPY
jgi:transitional endoplasmic reticulum ATPase